MSPRDSLRCDQRQSTTGCLQDRERSKERIRAHVILCWLALLLIRIVETQTGTTWTHTRRELDRLHLGTFTGPAGTFQQLTALTRPQRDLLATLEIPTPKQVVTLQPAPR
nr:hypothetical protein [Pseudonocardia nigra]